MTDQAKQQTWLSDVSEEERARIVALAPRVRAFLAGVCPDVAERDAFVAYLLASLIVDGQAGALLSAIQIREWQQ